MFLDLPKYFWTEPKHFGKWVTFRNNNICLNFSDIAVTVVMPIVAPIMKVENCKKYGANVLVHGKVECSKKPKNPEPNQTRAPVK